MRDKLELGKKVSEMTPEEKEKAKQEIINT